MTEFQAYEFTDVEDRTAESVLRRVREHYAGHVYWRRVYANLKGPGPFNLAAVARAAEHQGQQRAEAVLTRLREAPGEDVVETLADVPGLDVWRLLRDVDSEAVRWSVEADARLAQRHGTLPTVLFRGPGGDRVVSGVAPFEEYVAAIDAVAPLLEAA
ncbi:DsbA family protein [Solirubrobacter taibaiensis]|nr:DsbA family protein [Solirubrobacter taibaiensis]